MQTTNLNTENYIFQKNTAPDRRILAIGSLAFDSIKSPSGSVDRALGGSANYFSIAASLFTGINLVGVVGDDFPRAHCEVLKSRDIDLAGLETVQGKTFHWQGEYTTNLNEAKTIATHLNVFESFNPKIPAEYTKTPYLFLGNIAPTLQYSVFQQVQRPKIVALDSMNYWITSQLANLKQTLSIVDLLIINETEALMLSGSNNIVDAASTIRGMGPKVVIVKRGEYGALMFTKNSVFSAPALPMPVVKDPTGAGDTFAGGVMGYLAHEGCGTEVFDNDAALRRAIIYGCVLASFTVEEFGFDRLIRVTKEEAKKRFETFIRMSAF